MTSWRGAVARGLNTLLRPVRAELVASSELEGLRARAGHRHQRSRVAVPLPSGAAEYLRPDQPRLRQLQARYRGHPAATATQWTPDFLARELELAYFRGDNAYLHQQSVAADARYLLSAYYLKTIDRLGLFEVLDDDELFGNYVVPFDDNRVVSRDLLDSIAEITFLDETLGLAQRPDLEVLDIGAGYGRLAYRLATALPNLACAWCADGVAESTFLAEYYLGFRGVQHKASVVELNAVEACLADRRVHLATNIHSFSECSRATIRWWLDLVRRLRVPYLFIVPNDDRLLSTEADRQRQEFLPDLLERGYRLVAKQPKYRAPGVQRHGAFPATYFLFELTPPE